MSDTLPQADLEVLAGVTERLRNEKGWASFVTFDGLLRDWSVLVSRLEREYDTSIYEYANDLDTREILEEVLGSAPVDLRPRLAATLRRLDNRFMGATRPVDHPVAGR